MRTVDFRDGGLITSDSPVLLNSDGPESVGFGTAEEILFPLDRAHLAVFGEFAEGADFHHLEGNAENLEEVNQLIARHAWEEIFISPENNWRRSEFYTQSRPIMVATGIEDFHIDVDGLNNVPDRKRPRRFS